MSGTRLQSTIAANNDSTTTSIFLFPFVFGLLYLVLSDSLGCVLVVRQLPNIEYVHPNYRKPEYWLWDSTIGCSSHLFLRLALDNHSARWMRFRPS